MARAIALLLAVIAMAAPARADDLRSGRRFHLSPFELFGLFETNDSRAEQANDLTTAGILDRLEQPAVGLPPLFTLVPPEAASPNESLDAKPPLFAFGARFQGRTLVAFTRSATRVDPDDHVVYQRLVVSDLFQGRRFSVTVFEDHALGSSATQILGFGARLMLRPTLEIAGWRARIEFFASYDLTLGALGSIGISARSPAPPRPVRAP
jgi:hypothetical protein